MSSRASLALCAALVATACNAEEQCTSPGVEVTITLGADVKADEIVRVRATGYLDGAPGKSLGLSAGKVGLDSGTNRFAIVFDNQTITATHAFDLTLEALDSHGKLLASGRLKNAVQVNAGAACSQASVTLVKTGANATVVDLASASADLELIDKQTGPGPIATCDFDGDGAQDIVLAMPSAPGPLSQENFGRVYVLRGPKFGAVGPTSVVDLDQADAMLKVIGESRGQRLGETIACADLDRDDKDDLVIGAPASDSGAGKVYVIFGKKAPDAVIDLSTKSGTPDLVISGSSAGHALGTALAVAEGLVAGGHRSLLIGAPGYASPDGKRTNAGGLYIVLGRTRKDWTAATTLDLNTDPKIVTIVGAKNGERLGTTLAAGNLHDSDLGEDDIAAGGCCDGTTSCSGCAPVRVLRSQEFSAANTIDTSKDEHSLTVLPKDATGRFAESLAIGDHNADGVGDLIIGAPNEDKQGKVYVIFGKDSLLAQQAQPATSKAIGTLFNAAYSGEADSQFGAAVFALPQGAAGSTTDLLIGAPQGKNTRGAVYQFVGRKGFKPQEPIASGGSPHLLRTIIGAKAGDRLGAFLAGGVLSSGDGKPDPLIAAPGAKKTYSIFTR